MRNNVFFHSIFLYGNRLGSTKKNYYLIFLFLYGIIAYCGTIFSSSRFIELYLLFLIPSCIILILLNFVPAILKSPPKLLLMLLCAYIPFSHSLPARIIDHFYRLDEFGYLSIFLPESLLLMGLLFYFYRAKTLVRLSNRVMIICSLFAVSALLSFYNSPNLLFSIQAFWRGIVIPYMIFHAILSCQFSLREKIALFLVFYSGFFYSVVIGFYGYALDFGIPLSFADIMHNKSSMYLEGNLQKMTFGNITNFSLLFYFFFVPSLLFASSYNIFKNKSLALFGYIFLLLTLIFAVLLMMRTTIIILLVLSIYALLYAYLINRREKSYIMTYPAFIVSVLILVCSIFSDSVKSHFSSLSNVLINIESTNSILVSKNIDKTKLKTIKTVNSNDIILSKHTQQPKSEVINIVSSNHTLVSKANDQPKLEDPISILVSYKGTDTNKSTAKGPVILSIKSGKAVNSNDIIFSKHTQQSKSETINIVSSNHTLASKENDQPKLEAPISALVSYKGTDTNKSTVKGPIIPTIKTGIFDHYLDRLKGIRSQMNSLLLHVGDNSVSERLDAMIKGVEIFIRYPIVPSGFGVYHLYDPIHTATHNFLIQQAAEGGVLGLIASIMIIIFFFKNAFFTKKNILFKNWIALAGSGFLLQGLIAGAFFFCNSGIWGCSLAILGALIILLPNETLIDVKHALNRS